MNWYEMKQNVRRELQEMITFSTLYTDIEIYNKLYQAQTQVASALKYAVGTYSFNLTTTTANYTLPEDLEDNGVIAWSCHSGFTLEKIPNRNQIIGLSTPPGTPYMYDIYDNKVLFYPSPGSSMSCTLFYKKRLPQYAFKVYNGASSSTILKVSDTSMKVSNGTLYSQNLNSGSLTMASLVAIINNNTTGTVAIINPEILTTHAASYIHDTYPEAATIVSGQTIYGLDNMYNVSLDPIMPDRFENLIQSRTIINLVPKTLDVDTYKFFQMKHDEEFKKFDNALTWGNRAIGRLATVNDAKSSRYMNGTPYRVQTS